jgi:hypothetical protein
LCHAQVAIGGTGLEAACCGVFFRMSSFRQVLGHLVVQLIYLQLEFVYSIDVLVCYVTLVVVALGCIVLERIESVVYVLEMFDNNYVYKFSYFYR